MIILFSKELSNRDKIFVLWICGFEDCTEDSEADLTKTNFFADILLKVFIFQHSDSFMQNCDYPIKNVHSFENYLRNVSEILIIKLKQGLSESRGKFVVQFFFWKFSQFFEYDFSLILVKNIPYWDRNRSWWAQGRFVHRRKVTMQGFWSSVQILG